MFEREEMFERGGKNYRSRESVRSITLNHRSHLAVYRHFIIVQKTRASFAYEMLKSLYEGVIVTIKNREENVENWNFTARKV